MNFLYLDIKDKSEEEIIEILEHNEIVKEKRLKEIEKLKSVHVDDNNSVNETIIRNDYKEMNSKKSSFEKEILTLITRINSIQKGDIEKQLLPILPSRDDGNYKNILMRLLIEIKKNINEIYEIILDDLDLSTNKNDISLDELIDLKEDIVLESKKYDIINDCLNYEDDYYIEESDTENILVFATTSGGSVRLSNDIKQIDNEYYPSIIELLDSIKNGRFKGIKRFTDDYSVNGVLEVRSNKIRVLFDRIDKNKYVIISAFVKNSTKESGYKSSLKSKVRDYRKEYNYIKENIDNPDYIYSNSLIESEIYEMLNDSKNKGRVKNG